MKKTLCLLFALISFINMNAQTSDESSSFTESADTLSYYSSVAVNDIPVLGYLYELVNTIEYDSIGFKTMECGSVFDDENASFFYLFRIHLNGISFDSNGDKYILNSMDMKGNVFSFVRDNKTINFTESTTFNDFLKVFGNSESYPDPEDSNRTVANVYLQSGVSEDYWIFTFEGGKLAYIDLFFLLC